MVAVHLWFSLLCAFDTYLHFFCLWYLLLFDDFFLYFYHFFRWLMNDNFWNNHFLLFLFNLIDFLVLLFFINDLDLYFRRRAIFLVHIIKTKIYCSNRRSNTFDFTFLIFIENLLKRLKIHCIFILLLYRLLLHLSECLYIWYSCCFLLYFLCRCSSVCCWADWFRFVIQLLIVKFIRPAWRNLSWSHSMILPVLSDIFDDISKQTLTFLSRMLLWTVLTSISSFIGLTVFIFSSYYGPDGSFLHFDSVCYLRIGLMKIKESV